MDILKAVWGIVAAILVAAPLLIIVWLFAWLKDIKVELRKVRDVLKKRFPEDFPE